MFPKYKLKYDSVFLIKIKGVLYFFHADIEYKKVFCHFNLTKCLCHFSSGYLSMLPQMTIITNKNKHPHMV